MASITTEGRNELIALYTAMFNAVPGATQLSEIVLQRESGKSLVEVANFLTGKADFSKVYPALLTADEFAARLSSSMLGNEASADATTWATNWVKAQLAAGKGPAFVFATAVQSLRSTTSPDFKLAKDMLANKVDVGSFFAVTKGLDGTLVQLQDLINTVTSNPATSLAEKNDIEVSVNPPSYAIAAGATSVNEGSSLAFTLTTTNVASGTSVPYTISGVSAADVTGGALTGSAVVTNGKATITVGLAADRTTEGAETLTVTAAGKSASATVNDTSLNPVYTLTADAATVNEGSSATFTIGSTGVDAGTMVDYTISGVSAADVTGGMLTGKATVGADGKATVTVGLVADQTTETAETVTVTVGTVTASTSVVDTSITPVLATDTATGTIVSGQGTAIVTPASLLTNDTGSDGKALTGTPTLVAASATNGEIFTTKDGNFLFVANSGSRTGSFQYEVAGTNGKGTVNVLLNGAPVVTTTALAATEDTKATGTVTATDADGDALTYSYAAKNGTVTGTTSSFEYTPNKDFNGSDTITVTVKDGFTTVTKDIAVTVAAVDDAPAVVTPAPATLSANSGSTVTVDLSKYATDVDTKTLTYTADAAKTTLGGTVTVSGSTATVVYAQGGGSAALGSDSFKFSVTDGTTPASGVSVGLSVVNTAPSVTNFALAAKTGITQTVDLTGKASDAEGNTLTPTVVLGSLSSGGSAEVKSGQIIYTSTVGFVGTETLKYTVTDGFGGSSSEGTITFTVASNTGGTSGNDLLYGSTSAEAIDGLAGDDTIIGGGGADTIIGGDGNDTVTYNDNAKQILGGAGTGDTLVVNSDAISGKFDLSSTTDQVTDGLNTTIVVRGFENMNASKASNDMTIDQVSADTSSLVLGNGNDTITSMATAAATSTVVVQTNGGNDTITSGITAVKFSIEGGDGNDTISIAAATATTNSIYGGAGNDTITFNTTVKAYADGGDGNDAVTGSNNNDTILGGAGNDTITTDAGNDSVSGGQGNDTFTVAGNLTTADTIDGGDGTDTLSITTAVAAVGDLSGVSNVEVVKTSGNVTLAGDKAGLTTIDISDGGDQIVTLNTGVTAAITVVLTSDSTNADKIVNAANVALTVEGNGADVDAGTTITGGTGNDTLSLRADNGTADFQATTGIETITVRVGATATDDITIVMGAVDTTIASGKTLTVDGTALTDAGATLTFTGNAAETDGKVSVTGGAGADTLTGTNSTDTINGGANNDTIDLGAGNDVGDGGDGNDTITIGAGNDSVTGGAGNDTFVAAGNLAATDTLAGGDGTDTVTASGTVADAAFTLVTSVETIKSTAGTFTLTVASLAQAAGVTTIDLTDAGDDIVTFASGWTNAAKVVLTGDNGNSDKITNTANIALTVEANGDDIDAGTTITGGTGTDVLSLRANNGTATITATTGIETVTVRVGATVTDDITITMGANDTQIAATKTLTVDGTALTDAGATLTFTGVTNETDGKVSVTGGAGADTLTGTNGNDTLSGGANNDTLDLGAGNDSGFGGDGNDTITTGAGNDNVSGGAGNDTFTLATNLTSDDTLAGGDGTDTLSIQGTIGDVMFTNVTSVETVKANNAAALDLTLGATAQAAGVATVDTSAAANDIVTIGTGFTNAVTVVMTGNATNADKIVNTANVALTVEANGADIDAATTITGGTGTDTLSLRADNGTATITLITAVETITVRVGATATDDITIAMGANNTQIASGKTLTVNATALTDAGATLTFTGDAAEVDGSVSVTGGAGADTITGTNGADVIIGGGGADQLGNSKGLDSLTGGAGADIFLVVANTNGNIFSTITDAAATDIVRFADKGTETFTTAKITLGDTAVFSDYLNQAASGNGGTNGIITWFQFNSNTFVVQDIHADATFKDGTDFVVKLTGLVDLSTATVGDHQITLA